MNAPSPIPSRMLRASAAAVRWMLWLLLGAWLLLAVAWGALHVWIVPRIDEMRPALELEAGRALGVPVRIGAISARSEGLIPSFELRDVRLLDPQGRTALHLPMVVGALSPHSLWNLGFEQLYIAKPTLDVRRARDGRIFVAGLDFSRAENGSEASDWLFGQGEFVIEGGTLQWTDELRQAPTLELTQVRLVLRNNGRRHAVRLDATPPHAWGSPFTIAGIFREPFLTVPGNHGWQHWVGQLHADFGTVDLAQLRRHAPVTIGVASGRGQLRAWADLDRGQVVGGVVDVVASDVHVTLEPGLEPLSLRSASGRIGGQRDTEGFRVETENLQFLTDSGLRWPGGALQFTWAEPRGTAPGRGELRADRIELAALAHVATRLPLGTATLAMLEAYAPKGVVEGLQASWQGNGLEVGTYDVKGRARGLAIAARSAADGVGTPGVRGASVDFNMNQAGGRTRVTIENGALDFPGVFEESVVPVDSLQADLQWRLDGAEMNVTVDGLKFSNADAQGEGQGRWRTGDARAGKPGRFPGVLDLQGSLGRADGARVWRYLPLGVPKEARDYVHQSVKSGQSTGTKFRVKGDLRDFPFVDAKTGQFLITAQVRNVHYAYAPQPAQGPEAWPALNDVAGELVFQGNGMQIKGVTGHVVAGPRLQVKAEARIPNFNASEVNVAGRIQGPLAEALGVVSGSAIAGLAQNALSKTTGTGSVDVDLGLQLPLQSLARSQVRGTVTLGGNDVQLSPETPALARARGAVTFSERGFQLVGMQARALGGDVRLEGGARANPPPGEPAVTVRAQGTLTAEGLRQARELGFVSRLARDFAGSTSYTLALGFRGSRADVSVTSSLQGLALNLPAPLAKPADAVLPLRFDNALTRESTLPGAQRQLDVLSLELGRLGSVAYVRDVTDEEPRVLRGAIGIGLASGESAVMPEEGVQANVQLVNVNVDAWEALLARASGNEGAPAAAPAAQGADAGVTSPYLPTVIALRARSLAVEGRTLHNVVVGGSRDGRMWRANVDAEELSGYVEYRQAQGASSGRVHARLARVAIGAATASQVETLLEQPGSIPALDVVVDDFELKGRKLGRLEIDAVNRGAATVAREGGVREWRLNKLSLQMPEATFTASGNWAATGNAPAPVVRPAGRAGADGRRTVMKFNLDIRDGGELLTRMGMRGTVRRARGAMEGTLAWMGSPLALDYPTLTGNFRIDVAGGQFLRAEPGMAKLLGVLSLQALPRRLALDFRDVFSEGFTFDFVRGDVLVDQGMASTNNLQMKGVNAAVLMEGRADIARETQDLKVVVVPEINAGTASLVAVAINPAVGLGSFLAQLVLREPLIRAATQEFHVEGTWTDPKVTKVDRSSAALPAQTAAEPASIAPAITR